MHMIKYIRYQYRWHKFTKQIREIIDKTERIIHNVPERLAKTPKTSEEYAHLESLLALSQSVNHRFKQIYDAARSKDNKRVKILMDASVFLILEWAKQELGLSADELQCALLS